MLIQDNNPPVHFFSKIKRIFIIVIIFCGILLSLIWLYFNYSFFEKNTGYLKNFVLSDGPINIADTASQSSGLAYNADNNRLYLIVNEPTQIHVLTDTGKYIRKIDLQGFEDTEGIAYIGNDLFAVISEGKGQISWFKITPETVLIKKDPEKTIDLFDHFQGNTGLEGITYSNNTKQLFVVKERNPKKIYAVSWPIKNTKHLVIKTPWNAEEIPWRFVRSYSGIAYHPLTGHLFILSRRSRQVIEYTLAGKKVGSFSLKKGTATDHKLIRKAEGIAFSPKGTLYICGEPNQLYIFKPKMD